jgi:hypothetical protein
MHADVLTDLASMPDALESIFARIPSPSLVWTPSSWGGALGDQFSAIAHACHLRDIEVDGYHVRVRRMLEETRPSLESIDGDVLARERAYEAQDVREALRAFRSARMRTLEMLRGLKDDALLRPGIFAEYGEITLGGLIYFLRSHDHSHLSSLNWLLGKLAAR